MLKEQKPVIKLNAEVPVSQKIVVADDQVINITVTK
jgi:hypothetical protein